MNLSRFVPIVANQVLLLGLGILGLKVTSLIVSPADYGRYAIFLTLTQIGVLLTHSGLINLTSRHWQRSGGPSNTLAQFVWNRSWKGLRWLLPALCLLVVGLYASTGDSSWIYVLPMLIVGNLAVAMTEIGGVALNASERHWSVLWFRALATATRLSLPLLLVLAVGGGYFALVVGFSLHGLSMIVATAFVLRRPTGAEQQAVRDLVTWDDTLRTYGRPFAALGIGGWLLQNADRWIVARCFGAAQAGQFAMAAGMGGVVPMFMVAVLMQAFFPMAFREADAARSRADWERLARKCDYLTAGFLVATVAALAALALLGPALVGTLLEARYAPAIEMLFASGLAMAAVQINQFQLLLLQGRRDSRSMVRVLIVVAAIKTVGSLATAMVSWNLYLYWLGASVFVCAFVGRSLVRHAVFSVGPVLAARALEAEGK